MAALTADRDTALRECSDWARQAGEAKGRLEGSEAAGVVEEWRERALAAERERDALRAALEPFALVIRNHIPDDRPITTVAWTAGQHRAAAAALLGR